MSWLAKFNLDLVVKRLGTFRSTLLLVCLIITCLFCGYRIGNFFHSYQQQTLAKQQKRLDLLYADVEQYVKQINTLEVELEVERLANQNAQRLLKNVEQQHYQVKKELAFYEKIMAPEKQADGVVIDEVSMMPTASANHYRFQVILVQQKVKKRFAKGYVDMTFFGSLANKPSKITLDKVSTIANKSLAFSFQYFQILEGEVTLPEGFQPDKIEVSAVLPKGKWQKYHRINQSYAWREIVQTNAESTALILD